MSNLSAWQRVLAEVRAAHAAEDWESADAAVTSAFTCRPGNAHLLVLRGRLAQLGPGSEGGLDEIESTLREAVALDVESPAAAVELGHFLDAVRDDPTSAADTFGDAADRARELLAEALIGREQALRQIGRDDEANRCLAELTRLDERTPDEKRRAADLQSPHTEDVSAAA